MPDPQPDMAFQADLDRLRAKFGGFSPDLLADLGDSMLAEANAATAAAEERRLLASAADPPDLGSFPAPDDPRLEDGGDRG